MTTKADQTTAPTLGRLGRRIDSVIYKNRTLGEEEKERQED
jgi:hypothetical protein